MELHAPLLAQRGGREGERPPAAHFSSSSPFPQRRMVLQRMRKCNPMDQKKPPREKRGDNVCQCGSVGDGRRHMEQCAVGTSIYGRKNVRLHFFEGCTCAVKKLFSVYQAFLGAFVGFGRKVRKIGALCMHAKVLRAQGEDPPPLPPNLLSTGRPTLVCVRT